jgi:fructan beta-fructosidase
MRILFKFIAVILLTPFIIDPASAQDKVISKIVAAQSAQSEQLYRPAIHFTPAKGWMNDPNGMFYKDGIYHLYFQHYPDSTVWGPMHWGHATSTDLIHWKEQPIAIYPDSIGLIFSGSAVVDEHNTSGFGEKGKAPIVAIFTQHNMKGEQSGSIDFQTQSIAYSNDNGYTWKKYAGNPVIKNPGIKDFRDPKVMWYAPSQKWIMTLAVKNKVSFYSSPNLKDWTKESDFGMELGSHDGVWECPDLFTLKLNNKTYWVLTSSINPGGPNKGSATQYFIGDFDGHSFKSNSSKTKWMDYGADNYAGVTFSNTGDKRISIGWMSNWMYAQQVPTVNWRSATTAPRMLSIAKENGETFLRSMPTIIPKSKPLIVKSTTDIKTPFAINMSEQPISSFTITLSNKLGEHLDFGFDSTRNQYFIDRTAAGIHSFNNEFAAKHVASRISQSKMQNRFKVIIDKTSIELFGDYGLSVMTDIFFPSTPYDKISIQSNSETLKNQFRLYYLTP